MQHCYTIHQKKQRYFIFGDIHGQYDAMMALLQYRHFNSKQDHILFIGDLIDRGPKSYECLQLLAYPYVDACLGNHEKMLLDATIKNDSVVLSHWLANGGTWFHQLSDNKQQHCIDLIQQHMHWTMQLKWKQNSIGFVHADIPGNIPWPNLNHSLDDQYRHRMLWSRERVQLQIGENILGIDLVFVGHTVIPEIIKQSNVIAIDTGAALFNRPTTSITPPKITLIEVAQQMTAFQISPQLKITEIAHFHTQFVQSILNSNT